MRAVFIVLVVTVFLAVLALGERQVCRRHVRLMRREIRKIMGTGRRIAHSMRLPFHDCIGPNCDGCLNFDHMSNNGNWSDTVRLYIDLYRDQQFYKYVSYADFFVLIGIVAAEQGVENANRDLPEYQRVPKYWIKYRVGREDCATAPNTTTLPMGAGPNADHERLTNFTRDTWGMDKTETVAILGGHTLGGATGHSGFEGFWKENATESYKFDNRYYQMLVRPALTWNQTDRSLVNGFRVPRWQWEGFDRRGNKDSFMLNADLAIFMKIQLDPAGQSSCSFDDCQRDPEGLQAVLDYARSFQDFLADFEDAYTKMTDHGLTHRLYNPRSC